MKIIKTLLLFTLISLSLVSNSTHIAGGSLTYKHVKGFTYEFSLNVLTKIEAVQNNSDLDMTKAEIRIRSIPWDSISRSSKIQVNAGYYLNTFVFQYSFPGAGFYKVSYTGSDRVSTINNVSSDNVVQLYIECVILVSTVQPNNSSIAFYEHNVISARVNTPLNINLLTFSPDSDSISYRLVPPKSAADIEVPGYIYPAGLSIHPKTGEINWDAPAMTGFYAIAVVIEKWRNGIRIASVIKDILIEVEEESLLGDLNLEFVSSSEPIVEHYKIIPASMDSLVITVKLSTDTSLGFALKSYTNIHANNINSPYNIIHSKIIENLVFYIVEFKIGQDSVKSRQEPYMVVIRGISSNGETKDLSFLVYNTIEEPAGTSFSSTANDLVLFPNPAYGNIQIKGIESGQFLLYDLNGSVIKQGIISSLDKNIKTEDIPDDIYILEVVENGKSKRQKILIQH